MRPSISCSTRCLLWVLHGRLSVPTLPCRHRQPSVCIVQVYKSGLQVCEQGLKAANAADVRCVSLECVVVVVQPAHQVPTRTCGGAEPCAGALVRADGALQ